jgi:hypothetical protein
LLVKSETLMTGYWNRRDATERSSQWGQQGNKAASRRPYGTRCNQHGPSVKGA